MPATQLAGSILGSSVKRREDPRLITGSGRFVGDIHPAGMLHATFVRSPVAHGLLHAVGAEVARSMPGVVAVLTSSDLRLPPQLEMAIVDEGFARPPLATDRVRFVGDTVAIVVAETEAQSADGAQAVAADIEILPVVVDPLLAVQDGAPLLFPALGTNICRQMPSSAEGDVLAGAEVVVKATFVNQRLAPVPMEANAILVIPEEGGRLLVWASTQMPFNTRDVLARALGLDDSQVRVIAPDVGGGFGAKINTYPEHVVVAAVARRLGHPVRWVEHRSENMVAMWQGRGQVQEVELGATRDGQLVGLRLRVTADAGAYPGVGALLPVLTGLMASGVYRIPAIDFSGTIVATNTTPISAYRGAGRPEAAAALERSIDMLARELKMDPAELRRRNFIPPDSFPCTTASGATYDSGNYAQALEEALRLAGYQDLRREQARRRAAGERLLLGIGISVYVEVTALGAGTEFSSVEVQPGGKVQVLVGTSAHGQGHETAYAQIIADLMEVPMEDVTVIQSDTGLIPRGGGTAGSRSMQVGGSAAVRAAEAVVEKARGLAANLLEASPADVVRFEGGRFGVAGSPSRALSWAQLAGTAAVPPGSAAGPGPTLQASVDFSQADATYPFGSHVAVVEVDVETGHVRLARHVAVDDCGRVINPLLVEGQVHGGVAQGAAQALFEGVSHDSEGNPQTSSLLDYQLPTANELPAIETASTQTPSPLNPLGAKGIGESGTIGSTPAIWNAVVDAVSHLGISNLDMPLHPERVWRAIRGRSG